MLAALAFASMLTLVAAPASAAELEDKLTEAFSIACLSDPSDLDGYDERLRQAGFEVSRTDSRRTKDGFLYTVKERQKQKNDFCGGIAGGADPILTAKLVLQDLKAKGFQVADAVRDGKETTINAAFGKSPFQIKIDGRVMGRPPELVRFASVTITRMK